jgi:hypothetical protein
MILYNQLEKENKLIKLQYQPIYMWVGDVLQSRIVPVFLVKILISRIRIPSEIHSNIHTLKFYPKTILYILSDCR